MSFDIVRPAVHPPPVLTERRFQPTHLDFTRTQLISIFQQQALAYNCSPCCMLQCDREIRGPNAFLTLLPPEKHVEFVTRFQVYNNFSWVDAESLTMDIFKGQPTGTSSTRNIDFKIDLDNGTYVYIEVKKSSGHPYTKPTSIMSSLTQFHALTQAHDTEPKCRGSFYLIWSIDSLPEIRGRRKKTFATLWIVSVINHKGWHYFDSQTSKISPITKRMV